MHEPAIEPLLISISRLAALLDCDERTARRHLQTKSIPLRIHKIGGMSRVDYAEALAWVKAGSPAGDEWKWPQENDKPLRVAMA